MYHERTRRAAKPYRCDECRCQISIGDQYIAWFQIDEGEAFGGHLCPTCAALRTEAWHAFDWWEPEDAPSLGELRCYLKEEGIADPERWLADRQAARAESKAQVRRIAEAAAILQGSPSNAEPAQ